MVEAPPKKDQDMSSVSAVSTTNQSTTNSFMPGGEGAQLARRNVENPNRQITDFNLIRVIGTGTFGKVYLALLDGKPLALKALKKTQIINLKQVDHIKLEKNILAQVYHPFIVNL